MSKVRLLLTAIAVAVMAAASFRSPRATFLNRNATGSGFDFAEEAFA